MHAPVLRMNETHIELNGRAPGVGELASLALLNYGHFTSLRTEQGAVRGFNLHLQRLAKASFELFGTELDLARVRDLVRRAVGGASATVRITLFSLDFDRSRPELPQEVDILVSVHPLREPRGQPLRVRSLVHQRYLAHTKHVGTFELLHPLRNARLAGFDDVLFCTEAGDVCEGSTWNIGFWEGHRVVWPNAPALPGVTLHLLDKGLRNAGIETTSIAVNLRDLAEFRCAFAINTGSVGPLLASIDRHELDCDTVLLERLEVIYQQIPLEPI